MWVWFISNIAGGLLGAATVAWFKDTRAGQWCFDKYLSISYWASEELGVDILNKEEISWKTKYPNIEKRLFNLERSIEALEGSLKSNNKSKD